MIEYRVLVFPLSKGSVLQYQSTVLPDSMLHATPSPCRICIAEYLCPPPHEALLSIVLLHPYSSTPHL
jgi:hypothetical protein